MKAITPHNHMPVQHLDDLVPWCLLCGRTESYRNPGPRRAILDKNFAQIHKLLEEIAEVALDEVELIESFRTVVDAAVKAHLAAKKDIKVNIKIALVPRQKGMSYEVNEDQPTTLGAN
jgi:hypothetical protein